VYREVPENEWHVPLSQVIYVGDGASDMPAFALMNERRGLGIGVYKAESPQDWASRDEMYARRRVQNLAYADYTDGSELMKSLTLAVESICKEIALRKLGQDV
jgi:trehalose-6-phosphatase